MAVLIAGTVSLLIVQPTYADVEGDTSVITGTHKVWLNSQGMFKLKRFGEFCMPGELIKGPMPLGAIVVGLETKECPGIPQRFRKVVHEDYFGWMWDFALEVIDPLEGHIPPASTQEIPIITKEEDPEMGSTLPDINPDEPPEPENNLGSTLPSMGGTLPASDLE